MERVRRKPRWGGSFLPDTDALYPSLDAFLSENPDTLIREAIGLLTIALGTEMLRYSALGEGLNQEMFDQVILDLRTVIETRKSAKTGFGQTKFRNRPSLVA
jgi:hypothetical protein